MTNKPITPEEMKAYVDATWEKCQAEAWQEPRQWQGLTEEDIHSAFCHVEYKTFNNFVKNPEAWCIANARYLETILQEKNT